MNSLKEIPYSNTRKEKLYNNKAMGPQNTNSLAKLTPIHLRSNQPPLTMEAKSEKADQKSSIYYVAT